MKLRYLSFALLLMPVAAQAQSVIAITERDTTTTINPGAAADFSGASYNYLNVIHFNTVAGTDGATNLTIEPGAQNVTFTGLGNTVVTPPTLPAGSTGGVITAVSPGGTGQGFVFSYSGGDNGFLSSGVMSGRYDLTFNGGGTGIVDTGGTFLSTVQILGDYSATTAHTIATFSSDYTVLQNFVYSAGYTYFTVRTTNFQTNSPAISFSLLGASAVPEPATWAMMLVGFGMVGATMRYRRRKGAVRVSYAA